MKRKSHLFYFIVICGKKLTFCSLLTNRTVRVLFTLSALEVFISHYVTKEAQTAANGKTRWETRKNDISDNEDENP